MAGRELREVVLDTETTGLEPKAGHRIVEIGCVELINRVPSGRELHHYINPERDMPAEAAAIHGLTTEFLKDKPVFARIVDQLLEFIADSPLVIHNAAFDIAFLNSEFQRLGKPEISMTRVVDSLALARKRHPGQPVSLDALCKRYGVDNSRREKHGALLDSHLLAEVYLELLGERQTSLVLVTDITRSAGPAVEKVGPRPTPLPVRLTEADLAAHAAFVDQLGDKALWKRLGSS